MRREVRNKTPQFTIAERQTEIYPFEKDGLQLKSSYKAEDVNDKELIHTTPGIAPYLRGPYSTMYVQKPLAKVTSLRRLRMSGFVWRP